MLTINNTLDGYLKDVEILGNTIQDEEDLADIRSVGEKVEGQELYEIPVLSVGKNLFDGIYKDNSFLQVTGGGIGNLGGASGHKATLNYIKLKPNSTYKFSTSNSQGIGIILFFYDKNKKYIRHVDTHIMPHTTLTTNENEYYIRWYGTDAKISNFTDVQIEEGTVATEYEPYVEDKLTILSPTPLEKVGDVADRIIEKDGVWGVEKNVKTDLLKGGNNENFRFNKSLAKGGNQFTWGANMGAIANKNSVVISSTMNSYVVSNEDYSSNIWIYNGDTYVIHHPTISTADEIKLWLQTNPTIVKFASNTPQFIPLPHDQQVKLRTFANKTNISFLTEIEGTIKAQVPKSLGATVNTHTEQINNLNKELDRVKKLEESTVSIVETESDFTTVEATSNGYFEDVKLEGKTLVNLADKSQYIPTIENWKTNLGNIELYKTNTTYTFIGDVTTLADGVNLYIKGTSLKKGYNIVTFTTNNTVDSIPLYSVGSPGTFVVDNVLILEGDHTQNPPSGYIEGLKSVGQGTDEIVVSSVNDNLFTCINTPVKMGGGDSNSVITNLVKTDTGFSATSSKERYGIEYAFTSKTEGYIYVKTEGNINSHISIWNSSKGISQSYTTIATNYVKFPCKNGELFQIGIRCRATGVFSVENIYVAYSEIETNKCSLLDKKRLLYYNNETQTWEKPILREWDSIEKHADGKYYYHQRSGEVVLNGSENWVLDSVVTSETTIRFRMSNPIYMKSNSEIISDKFRFRGVQSHGEYEYIWNNAVALYINSLQSKLSTQDVEGFKQWLQANNVTVVYQLAEEKVYECTNIDLITYANETNYIVECGAIVPKSTLKVHNNISNVVSLLQKKVSLLESNMTKYMVTQNRMQLASTYSADSVTFKVDYFSLCGDEENYDEDLYNLILNNILVGKDNYNYDKMFTMILDYASWNQISWEQFDILVGLMDIQHNPPVEELPTEDEIEEDIIEETPVE